MGSGHTSHDMTRAKPRHRPGDPGTATPAAPAQPPPHRKTQASALHKGDLFELPLEVMFVDRGPRPHGFDVYWLRDTKTRIAFRWRYTGVHVLNVGEIHLVRGRVADVDRDGEIRITRGRPTPRSHEKGREARTAGTPARNFAKGDRVALTVEVTEREPVPYEHGVDVYRLRDPNSGTRFRWRYTGDYRMEVGERYQIRARVRYIATNGEIAIGHGRFTPADDRG